MTKHLVLRQMEAGSRDLTRAVTGYLVALSFAITFLLTVVLGAGVNTALMRGIIVAVIVRVVGPALVRPVLTSIFDAITQDQIRRSQSENPATEGEADS